MKALFSIIAAMALLALAGCGGDDDASQSPAATETTAAETNATTEAAGEKSTNNGSGSGSGGKEKTSQGSAADDFPIEPAGKLQGPEIKVEAPQGPPPKKLIVKDFKEGTGEEAHTGDKVTIQFTAIYYDGELFESSWQFGHPFRFKLGEQKVSPGWEKGIPGMKVGGRRELIVPYTLTSQFSPLPGKTAEDAQVYVVDLLDVS